jgi:hypothetical protein
MRSRRGALLLCGALVTAGCDRDAPAMQDATQSGMTEAAGDPVLVGAGDIASCWWLADGATGRLLDAIPGTVFTLGDNVYQAGTAAEFRKCYDPAWGRARERTYPSAGNHDERTNNGAAYYAYFGARAGPPGKGYYSYDLGSWHIVVYNSNSAERMRAGSEQMEWLRKDLAMHPSACVLAYGHHPRFSSGKRGVEERVKVLWDVLYAAGADVVVSGHEHFYERFAPQTPDGQADSVHGIRQIIAGTGGAPFYRIRTRAKNSEVRSQTHGVLKLTLHEGSYDWDFVPVRGDRFTDRGHGVCSALAAL